MYSQCMHYIFIISKSFSATISKSGIRNNQVLHGISSTCNCRQPACDVKASPAFILTRGVSCCFLCSSALSQVSMLWITPGQCKWPPQPQVRFFNGYFCLFGGNWALWVTSEFPKWEVEIRFSDSWGSTPDRVETALGSLEKFQRLCSSCTAYLIHT